MVITDPTKITYVIYKEGVENKESLDKFKDILSLAEYSGTLEFVAFESVYKDISNFIQNKISFICINSTYESFYKVIGDKFKIPIFEFSLNQYYDEKYNILISGLDLTCNEMFTQTVHKKTTWANFQSFVKYFNKLEFDLISSKGYTLPSKCYTLLEQIEIASKESNLISNTEIPVISTFLEATSETKILLDGNLILELAESLSNLSNIMKKLIITPEISK